MYKILFILLGLFTCISSFSQSEQKLQEEIQADFNKLTLEQVINLIPFQDKKTGKYGYLDAESKKIAIKPKYDELSFFKPAIEGTYKGEQFHSIIKDGKIFIELGVNWGNQSIALMAADYEEDMTSNNLKKGFTISTNKPVKILQYASIYNDVTFPFFYKEKYYAVASKSDEENNNNKYGIIDTEGNYLSGFEFKYSYLKLNRVAKDDGKYYFYALTDSDKELFINTQGEERVIREKKNPLSNKTGILRYDLNNFGYTIYDGGVYDLVNMIWVLDDPKITPIKIDYNSTKEIDNGSIYFSQFQRHKVNIFIKATSKDYPYPYYIDNKGNKYLP